MSMSVRFNLCKIRMPLMCNSLFWLYAILAKSNFWFLPYPPTPVWGWVAVRSCCWIWPEWSLSSTLGVMAHWCRNLRQLLFATDFPNDTCLSKVMWTFFFFFSLLRCIRRRRNIFFHSRLSQTFEDNRGALQTRCRNWCGPASSAGSPRAGLCWRQTLLRLFRGWSCLGFVSYRIGLVFSSATFTWDVFFLSTQVFTLFLSSSRGSLPVV